MVHRGGNYGWRVYEGPFVFRASESPGGNTSVTSINPIFPVMGYSHSETHDKSGSASVVGGFFYRSMTDPCMYGKYRFSFQQVKFTCQLCYHNVSLTRGFSFVSFLMAGLIIFCKYDFGI